MKDNNKEKLYNPVIEIFVSHTRPKPQLTIHCARYFREINVYMPLVDALVSPDEYYEQSLLLFWVIVAIASRFDDQEPTLLSGIAPVVKTLLWQTVANPPHARLDLKAMVLLCLWQFPATSMSTDTSFVLAATCRTNAMHVGIHKPHLAQDFSRVKFTYPPEVLRDALSIWAACFIASEK